MKKINDYNNEGFPIAALFCPKNNVAEFIIDNFLRVVLQQGYSFRYMTTDMDPKKFMPFKSTVVEMQFNFVYGILSVLC